MTFDLQDVLAIAGGCVMLGGQLAILQTVVRSNREQGKRLGALEQWKTGLEKVAEYKATRTFSRAQGIPVSDDETPP